MLAKRPGYAAVVVMTLALGIGATTVIFAVINATLLKSLPYLEPDRLALVWGTNHQAGQLRDVISGPNFLDLQRHNSVFEGMAAFHPSDVPARTDQGTIVVPSLEVTPGFFSVLGVEPLHGRAFVNEDDLDKVVLLSYGYWQRQFGGDPTVVGQTLTSIGQPHIVIGVLPPGFQFLNEVDLVTALAPIELEKEARTHYHYWVVARLKKGINSAQADEDLDNLMQGIAQQYPVLRGWQVTVDELRSTLVEPVRPALLVLLGAVGLLLLISCVNAANLLLVRGMDRRREFAVRAAMGAGPLRLIRQSLTESMLLAVLGGIVGTGLSLWGVQSLAAVLPESVPISDSAASVSFGTVEVDWRVLVFSVLLSGATIFLTGLIPALYAARVNAQETLKTAAGRGTTGGQRRVRNLLVTSGTALATALLIVSGLMLKTVIELIRVDPGFHAGGVMTMYVGAVHSLSAEQKAQYYDQVVKSVEQAPGVVSVGLNDYVLLQNEDDYEGFYIEGRPKPQPGTLPREEWRRVSSEYFQTMGIALMKGRYFTEFDTARTPSVVVINQTMAEKYWPGEDPVGQRVFITHKAYGWSEVIGIVRDVREVGLKKPPKPMMFVPYPRAPRPVMGLFAKTAMKSEMAAPAVKEAVWSVDKTQPIFGESTLDAIVSDATSVERLTLVVSLILAGIALPLTVVGIYTVVSYSVAQRTPEIAVRMALGARRRNIFGLVIREGLLLALIGILAGLGVALASGQVVSSLLYGVTSRDPVTLVGVSLLLTLVILLACLIPARRATKVEAMVALRCE
jgi:putative ABC transport system permease protein